jgi:glycosyltransferase involved in cell wall biosynthesis
LRGALYVSNATRVCMLVRNDCRTDYRVIKEAASLAKAGYEVIVVAINPYGPFEEEKRNGFLIRRIPVHKARTKLGRFFNLYPRAWQRMYGEALKTEAQIFHAHDRDTLLPAWLAARRSPGTKLVYDAHEAAIPSFRENLIFNVRSQRFSLLSGTAYTLFVWLSTLVGDRIVSKHADLIITVNDPLAQQHAAQFRTSPVGVVMNCPPRYTPSAADRSLLAADLGLAPDTPIILFHGMFVRQRHGQGLENLIRSAPLLDKGVIVFVGRGPQEEDLRRLSQYPEFKGRVFVLPFVAPERLLAYTSGATIGVIPTEMWHPVFQYSSPNKLFEYIAVGLPVVTSDLPIIRQICEEHRCGVLCDPRSPSSIAKAINSILAEPEQYSRMKAGALSAARVYNWEHQEEVLLTLYRSLAKHGEYQDR